MIFIPIIVAIKQATFFRIFYQFAIFAFPSAMFYLKICHYFNPLSQTLTSETLRETLRQTLLKTLGETLLETFLEI